MPITKIIISIKNPIVNRFDEPKNWQIAKEVAKNFRAQHLFPFVKILARYMIAEYCESGARKIYFLLRKLGLDGDKFVQATMIYSLYLLLKQSYGIRLGDYIRVVNKKWDMNFKIVFEDLAAEFKLTENRIVSFIARRFMPLKGGCADGSRSFAVSLQELYNDLK
jgi:hypothetical protein